MHAYICVHTHACIHMHAYICMHIHACMHMHAGEAGAGAHGRVGACMLNACAGRCADAGAGAVNRSRGPLAGAYA